MTSSEIRQSFLDFFKSKQHTIVPSAPVVPHGDPTLLFTNAGMNQFKDVFLGVGKRDYTRAADTQKCIRVSGKHNDLEEVGVDTYHHTLFEMLGNWSFGDYYKEEAIAWAWELLTDVWKLPKDRLYATVYETDDEALEIWKKYLPIDRIQKFGAKDNFWEMGDTGPCGPCSEIHFDGTPDKSGGPLVNIGDPQVIEIWNLVFIQFNRKQDGSLEPLASKHVDTGMGFERITRVIQGKDSNYDSDIFMPIINHIASLCGKKYGASLTDADDIAMRVIADHIRTLSFSIADGAMPGSEGRSYVLRRILRRASRFARNLGFKEPMLYKLLPTLIDTLGDYFTELNEQLNIIEKVIKGEEESFLQTLENGLEKINELLANISNDRQIKGSDAFLLYDSFGFPLDLTELIARENNATVDTDGFNKLMQEQKERSRSARKKTIQEAELPMFGSQTEFIGYTEFECEAKLLFAQENIAVFDKTPFYAESGGQVSDTGKISINGAEYQVLDMKKVAGTFFHYLDRELEAKVGDVAYLTIDKSRRKAIASNHSATHLMHEALRMTIGEHIKQQGSLVNDEYLRFDFNHFEKVGSSSLAEIENIVNSKIRENIEVITKVLTLDEAKENPKIKMYFGDKYGERVRAVEIDPKYSIELCGGTHVRRTGEISYFKIISESSVASGVRRVEAITGSKIDEYINSLHSKIEESYQKEKSLIDEIRSLEKEITKLKSQDLAKGIDELIANSKEVNGVSIIVNKITIDSNDELRDFTDELRLKAKQNSIIVNATILEEKVLLAIAVTDDLTSKYQAGKLISEAAKYLGGGGGGKPHLATAGGKDISKLDSLLNSEIYEIIGRV
jgi:alanyl-tRNA synthetase